jgi:serine/threonine protein kinase/CheY-like chemotaxis protein
MREQMADSASTPSRVLVVDDEEHNRDMLARRLRRRGYEVETAASGYEALDTIAQSRFDVIVLDVMMPGIDGFEVLRTLRERWTKLELPVVMATALDGSKDEVEALRLGANDYVTKPIDFLQLQARLEIQLALRQEFAALRSEVTRKVRTTDSMPAGTVLDGRYEIEARVGHGGFAVVYRARQLSTGQLVAIKVLRAHRAMRSGGGGVEYERFRREMQLIGAVRHPAVVQLIDSGSLEIEGGWAALEGETRSESASRGEGTLASAVGEEPPPPAELPEAAEVPYFVMEYLDGETLDRLLARRGALGLEDSLALMFPVLEGVHALHRRGIVHRDLKPANIFLHRSDQRGVQPKVLDFGIAKFNSQDSQDSVSQATIGFVGTPAYMAPEQALGARDLDGRCDQYALAVMLYECLCGERPFPSDNYTQVLLQVATGEFIPLAQRCNVPVEISAAITAAMSRDREQRYPDLEQFARALLCGAPEGIRARWASLIDT